MNKILPGNTSLFSKITPVHLIIIMALLQLVVAMFTNTLTLTHEESMWHYIGHNWFHHGLAPYDGGVDNKTPLIFIVFGISDGLFGVNYWFPRIAGTIVEAVGIYYIYRTAKHLAGQQAGILAISVYGLTLLWKVTGGKLVSFTETYATTCIIYSFYKCLIADKNKGLLASGIFAGLAIAFRVSACFSVLAILITCIRRNRSGTITFITGILCSTVLLINIALLAGIDLYTMLQHTVIDNFGAGSTTDHSLTWKLKSFADNFFLSELVLFYPFVIGYIFIKKKIDPLIIWLLCTFIGINVLGIYARPHFKELLPSLSLITAIALVHLSVRYAISFRNVLIITWVCFFPKIIEPLWGVKKWLDPPAVKPLAYCNDTTLKTDEAAERLLGLWIKANTKETDLVYVAGYGARVQAFSERLSPTIYFNVTQTAKAKERLFKDLSQTMPYLVAIPVSETYKSYVSADIRDSIDQLVTSGQYGPGICLYGYTIYMHRLAISSK